MQENNQEEKTVEDEMNEEIAKEEAEKTNKTSGDGAEAKVEEDEYLDLTKEEAQEEKKFQEVVNTADNPNEQDKTEPIKESQSEGVPDIEPAESKETIESTEEKSIVPAETANVIKDQDLIFLQYQCENEDCKFKFYVNNLDADIGEKLKCFRCGKKLMKKKRMFDVTVKAYRDYVEEEIK